MSRRRGFVAAGLLCAFLAFAGEAPVVAQDDRIAAALDNLVAAYPAALAGHDDKVLHWRDGTIMPLGDGAGTFAEALRHASIIDQLRVPYPRGVLPGPPTVDADPGRFRNAAFFRKMYGDCKDGDVARRLVALPWLPKTWQPKTRLPKTQSNDDRTVRITAVNGVDAQLKLVSAEIDTLPDEIKRAAYPIAGTYNCRAVADTGQPSPHGYGIAIDLNTAFSDYWYWRPHDGTIVYRNRMPQQIVDIFERHGFIWGGKWYHFDTMHFEYRPELLAAPGR